MRAALLALLLLAPGAAPGALAAPRLDAILPHPPRGSDGELVRLANDADAPAPLDGWTLATSRRALPLHGTVPAHGALTLARNATAARGLTGAWPDAEADLPPLADEGGALRLTGPGPGDEAAWGRIAPGMMLVRGPDGWAQRHVGWTDFAPLGTTAEVAPFERATALPALLAALTEARRDVRVEVYELTSAELAGALQAALARGVRVRVLVEGAPVGGLPAGESARLGALAAAGAEVRTIGGSGEDRYGTVHAKFAAVDDALAVLGSENWTPSGFAPDGAGNRGWGAVVRGADVARALARAWEGDADPLRSDVRAWASEAAERPPPPPSLPAALPASAPANVTLLLAPDNAMPAITALPARAARSLDLEFLVLPLAWPHGPNPLVDALRAAAARGVRVRVLLDGQDADNAATVANLTAAGIEARLAPFRVHNKGMVLDDALALVSSVNGGEASMLRNREAALLLDGPAVGTYARAFASDWRDAAPPAPGAVPAWAGLPLLLLAVLAVRRARRR